MSTILVVDDDAAVLFTLEEVLGEHGFEVISARSAEEARAKLGAADVVVTDLSMPGEDGLSLLAHVRATDASLPVILVTAHGSERVAAQSIKRGAYDYLAKPFDVDELVATVSRAAETTALRQGARRSAALSRLGCTIIAESEPMKRLLALASKVAQRELPALVTGPTGSGKELIATLLHAESPRSPGPLLRFNCAAIPAELAEAELFGHKKGAFTGADRDRKGLFREASGGTLVLDEIGELPLAVQAKLLRAVQFGEVMPLGQAQPERVDVRIVACTHRDLLADAERGQFRSDLYYRLAVVVLEVPALARRPEDVAPLARFFATRAAARYGRDHVRLSRELLAALSARPWPGNVRELENVITRAVALSETGEIDLEQSGPGAGEPGSGPGTYREKLAAFEQSLLQEALRDAGGNQSEAARRLGLSRVTFLDKLKRLGIGGQS